MSAQSEREEEMQLPKRTYELVEMGTYAAVVETILEEEGKYGPQLRFNFRIVDSDVALVAWAKAIYSSSSKLGKWTQAILGEQPDMFDSDDLIGKPCRIVVLVKQREDGTEYNKIDDVLPARKQKPRPQPLPEADDDDEPESVHLPF